EHGDTLTKNGNRSENTRKARGFPDGKPPEEGRAVLTNERDGHAARAQVTAWGPRRPVWASLGYTTRHIILSRSTGPGCIPAEGAYHLSTRVLGPARGSCTLHSSCSGGGWPGGRRGFPHAGSVPHHGSQRRDHRQSHRPAVPASPRGSDGQPPRHASPDG